MNTYEFVFKTFLMSLLSLLELHMIRDSSDKYCFVPEDEKHHCSFFCSAFGSGTK